MKKYICIVIVLVMAVAVNAAPITGLKITLDGNTLGVDAAAGTILATARFEVVGFDLGNELDWSGFYYDAAGYNYLPTLKLPWGGVPAVLNTEENLFTFFTSTVTAPTVDFTVFKGVALPEGWSFFESPVPIPGAYEIRLVADVYETAAGPIYDAYFGSIYLPEPMTMTLLGVGGLAAIRRRR